MVSPVTPFRTHPPHIRTPLQFPVRRVLTLFLDFLNIAEINGMSNRKNRVCEKVFFNVKERIAAFPGAALQPGVPDCF